MIETLDLETTLENALTSPPRSKEQGDPPSQMLKGLFSDKASSVQGVSVPHRQPETIVEVYPTQRVVEIDPVQKAAEEAAHGVRTIENLYMIFWLAPPNIIASLNDEKCEDRAKTAYRGVLKCLPYPEIYRNFSVAYLARLRCILDIADNQSKQSLTSTCPDFYTEVRRQACVVGKEIELWLQDRDGKAEEERIRQYLSAKKTILSAVQAIEHHGNDQYHPRLTIEGKYRNEKGEIDPKLLESCVRIGQSPRTLEDLGMESFMVYTAFYSMELLGPVIEAPADLYPVLFSWASTIASFFPRRHVTGEVGELFYLLAERYKKINQRPLSR